MTTSPTFTYSRDQIIRRSLRQCGAIAAGDTPGAQEVSDASDALNAMVAEWQASGLHLWKEKEATLFLQPSQYNYGLPASTSHVCATPLLNQTTTTFGYAAGVSSIQVGSASGFGDGDAIGIMLASNALFWTTVTGVGGAIGLASPLPSAVNAGAVVFDYPQSAVIYRPLRVLNVRRILWSSMIETMVTPMSRLDYRNQPDKTQTGVVTQYFYDPQLGIGQFWAWPNPLDSTNGLRFTYMEPIYDFNTAADYPDFPQEWINCLVWNLSQEIGIEYDIPAARWAMIVKRAEETKDVVSGFDREPESFYLGVNFDQTSRGNG